MWRVHCWPTSHRKSLQRPRHQAATTGFEPAPLSSTGRCSALSYIAICPYVSIATETHSFTVINPLGSAYALFFLRPATRAIRVSHFTIWDKCAETELNRHITKEGGLQPLELSQCSAGAYKGRTVISAVLHTRCGLHGSHV